MNYWLVGGWAALGFGPLIAAVQLGYILRVGLDESRADIAGSLVLAGIGAIILKFYGVLPEAGDLVLAAIPIVIIGLGLGYLGSGRAVRPQPAPETRAEETQQHVLKRGMSVPIDLLVRGARDADGANLWRSGKITSLSGEELPSGWIMMRSFTFAAEGSTTTTVPVDRIIVLRDAATRDEFRGSEEIARFLRLAAGGINERDEIELKDWQDARELRIERRAARSKPALPAPDPGAAPAPPPHYVNPASAPEGPLMRDRG